MFDIKYLSNHYFYCFDYKQQERSPHYIRKVFFFFSCEHKFAVKIQCLKKQKFKDPDLEQKNERIMPLFRIYANRIIGLMLCISVDIIVRDYFCT